MSDTRTRSPQSLVRLATLLVLPVLACGDDSTENDVDGSSSSSEASTSPTVTSLDTTTVGADSTSSSDETSTSSAEDSTTTGNDATLLERVALALGGADQLAALEGFTVASDGSTRNAGEGPTLRENVVDGSTFHVDLSVDVQNRNYRLDHDRTIVFEGLGVPLSYSEIIAGDIGAVDGADNLFGFPSGAMPSDRWASTVRRQRLLNPQLLIIEALADTSIATETGTAEYEGVEYELLELADEVAPLVLWIDPATDLPARLTSTENNWLHRDVVLEVAYDGWAASDGGVLFPGHATLATNGVQTHDETRASVSTVVDLAPELFQIPEGSTSTLDEVDAARGRRNHSLLQEFQTIGIPAWGVPDFIMPIDLGPAVHFLTGPSHHSIIVEQADGLVLLETPQFEARCEALLDWAEAQFPGKSVTHAVVTHSHVDHAGCARTLVARGATLVVGEGSDTLWTDVLAAPSTVEPDELEANPVEPTIEYVPDGGSFVIDDADAPVTVYDVDSTHSFDMVLSFVDGVVFQGDLFNPGTVQLIPIGAQELLDALELHGITGQVQMIAGVHGFGTATVADVQAAAGQ
jgi:glyoxylase-like metal-dependent hydrolase (beta-lactamase superfamily II)